MTEALESTTRWRVRWLMAIAVAAGMGAAVFTGTGVAFAEDGTASTGNSTNPAFDVDTEPSTLPPGIRIANRTLGNLSESSYSPESPRLQMSLDRLNKSLTTLSNVLKNASTTAQTVTGNIK